MIYKEKPKGFNQEHIVVGCFIEVNGKILMLKRNNDKHLGGKWGIVNGKAEKGETPKEAMAREIKEESGLSILPKQLTLLKTYMVNQGLYDFDAPIYILKIDKQFEVKLNPNEHSEYKWVTPDEFLKLDFVDDLDTVVKDVFDKGA